MRRSRPCRGSTMDWAWPFFRPRKASWPITTRATRTWAERSSAPCSEDWYKREEQTGSIHVSCGKETRCDSIGRDRQHRRAAGEGQRPEGVARASAPLGCGGKTRGKRDSRGPSSRDEASTRNVGNLPLTTCERDDGRDEGIRAQA